MIEVREPEAGADTVAKTVRLPVELAEWLRQTAFDARRSQNSIIEEALNRYRESG